MGLFLLFRIKYWKKEGGQGEMKLKPIKPSVRVQVTASELFLFLCKLIFDPCDHEQWGIAIR